MKMLNVLVVLGFGAMALPVNAEVTTNIITPFVLDVSPANCSTATSHIQGGGKGLTLLRTTVSGNGQVHIGVTFNATGKGTDNLGVNWSVADGDNFYSFNGYLTGGAMEVTATENFQLVSHGSSGNITVHAVMKIRVAADGSTTVEFVKERGAGESCELGLIF